MSAVPSLPADIFIAFQQLTYVREARWAFCFWCDKTFFTTTHPATLSDARQGRRGQRWRRSCGASARTWRRQQTLSGQAGFRLARTWRRQKTLSGQAGFRLARTRRRQKTLSGQAGFRLARTWRRQQTLSGQAGFRLARTRRRQQTLSGQAGFRLARTWRRQQTLSGQAGFRFRQHGQRNSNAEEQKRRDAFSRMRGFWIEDFWRISPRLCFFLFSFFFFLFSGEQRSHCCSTAYARISLEWLSELRRLWPSVPWRVGREFVTPTGYNTMPGQQSAHCDFVGSRVFACLGTTAPPTFLAGWPGSFTCFCGRMGVERTLNKESAQKVSSGEENNSPGRSCRNSISQPFDRSRVRHTALPTELSRPSLGNVIRLKRIGGRPVVGMSADPFGCLLTNCQEGVQRLFKS